MAWYVVNHGRKTGIFASWEECHRHVNGFLGALYKKYKTKEEAMAAFFGPAGKGDVNMGGEGINNMVVTRCSYNCPVHYNSVVSYGHC